MITVGAAGRHRIDPDADAAEGDLVALLGRPAAEGRSTASTRPAELPPIGAAGVDSEPEVLVGEIGRRFRRRAAGHARLQQQAVAGRQVDAGPAGTDPAPGLVESWNHLVADGRMTRPTRASSAPTGADSPAAISAAMASRLVPAHGWRTWRALLDHLWQVVNCVPGGGTTSSRMMVVLAWVKRDCASFGVSRGCSLWGCYGQGGRALGLAGPGRLPEAGKIPTIDGAAMLIAARVCVTVSGSLENDRRRALGLSAAARRSWQTGAASDRAGSRLRTEPAVCRVAGRRL